MTPKHHLDLVWAKAFGEVYCHHASLFIPYTMESLFMPELITIGVTIRMNIIDKRKIKTAVDRRIEQYLPCKVVDGGIQVPLNSSSIIESLCINSWTYLKNGERGQQKEYPINIFYRIDEDEIVTIPFNSNVGTPYLYCESSFGDLKDGDTIESTIQLEL